MTDTAKALFVVLDGDYSGEALDAICSAIEMVKGVSSVQVDLVNFDDYANRDRIARQYEHKIYELLRALREGKA